MTTHWIEQDSEGNILRYIVPAKPHDTLILARLRDDGLAEKVAHKECEDLETGYPDLASVKAWVAYRIIEAYRIAVLEGGGDAENI